MADDLSEQDIFDSAVETEEAKTPEPESRESEQPTGQPRDEHGRFAPVKAEEAPAPEAPQPQTIQPTAVQEPKTEPAQAVPPGLLEERRRRQEAEQRAQAIERQLAEVQGYLRGQQQRPQEQAQLQQPQQDPMDRLLNDPRGFVSAELKAYAEQHIAPLQQKLIEDREYWSARAAEKDYGKETVQAARAWIEPLAMARDPDAIAILNRVNQSRDPYGELVQQYQQRQTIKEVGSDPNAWFEKTLEARLADPAFQQKIAQKLGPAPAQAPAGRSAPIVRIPSINQASGSAASPADSIPGSEEELFAVAPRRMGRRD